MIHWIFAADPQVQAAFVGGLLALLATGTGGILALLKTILSHMQEVKHQVKNSHSSNLRDDLDVIRDDLKEVLRVSQANTGAIQLLHEDIRDERRERIRLDGRVECLERHAA